MADAEDLGIGLDGDAFTVAPISPTFTNAAEMLHTTVEDLIGLLLFSPERMPFEDKQGNDSNAIWLPGNQFATRTYGPCKHYDVMVIGKNPDRVAEQQRYNLAGEAENLLKLIGDEIGYHEIDNWYITNIVKFNPPDLSKKPSKRYIKDGMCLLAQEIALIKPKLIITLGAEPLKALCGNKATLSGLRGTLLHIAGLRGIGQLPQPYVEGESQDGFKLIATISPGAVLREDGFRAGFTCDLALARDVERSINSTIKEEKEYIYTSDPEVLHNEVDKILASDDKYVAMDVEGGGDFKSGQLRSIQFSNRPLYGVAVVLLKAGGEPTCDIATREKLIAEVRRLVTDPSIKLIGHHFRYDAKWLEYQGMPCITKLFFDTMLADHILNENAEHGLEACSIRYTNMGRYDIPLYNWIHSSSCPKAKGQGLKAYLAERGYLDIPDEILLPYSVCDVDCTIRVFLTLRKELDLPKNALLKHLYYEVVMPCNMPLHEIEKNGMLADRDRMIDLGSRFATKRDEILEKIRRILNDGEFNPRSHPQCKTLLFDTLGLAPYKSTGKPSRQWADVLALPPEKARLYTPAVDLETLEALVDDDKTGVVAQLRDYRIINQLCQNFLPEVDENDECDKGLIGSINSVDNRIHSSFSQTSETGRHKSSNPNLQNLPSKQNKEIDRIMGKGIPKIRSCFVASPGHVLIEADYKSAEIYTLGYLSNCDRLVKDADADLHSRGAVLNFGAPKWNGFDDFKLPPEEWKNEFKALRISAKTVNFGIPYLRGAKAVAREITTETKGVIQCTTERAQEVIDGFYNLYDGVPIYIEYCKACVMEPGYISNAFGRRRRFLNLIKEEKSFIAAMQREAVNQPIQGTVADTMNTALINLWYWKLLNPGRCDFKIVSCIHDAALLEVPGEDVGVVVDEVLPQCMRYGAVVPSWQNTPNYKPTKPFTLDIDTSVYLRWSEKPKEEELKELHVPDKYIEQFAA